MKDIILCNGRGQLGSALSNILPVSKNRESIGIGPNRSYIYHTWNFLNKEQSVQQDCYNKFVEFVDQHNKDEIIFISTYSEKDNSYTYYKQLAESYLLTNIELSKIIKLPIIIGNGICRDLKTGKKEPYGLLELISIEDAAKEINVIAQKPHIQNRVFRVKGEIVLAKLATQLLTFK